MYQWMSTEDGAEKAAFTSNLRDVVKMKHGRKMELEPKKEAQRVKREQQEKRHKTLLRALNSSHCRVG